MVPNLSILFITPNKERLTGLAAAMADGGAIYWASAGGRALEMLAEQAVDLAVADDDLADMTGLDFIERLVKRNPMINCALVSALSPDDYHAASEGLGILMQLPSPPSAADGQRLVSHLRQIMGLAASI